jgi:hypothetical protein
MKSKIIYLLLFCSATLGMPGTIWGAQTAPGQTQKPALVSPKGTAPAVPVLGASEKSALALLGSADPGLLQQRAGDRIYVDDGGMHRWHRGYGYGLGGLLLTVLLVAVLVVVVGGGNR